MTAMKAATSINTGRKTTTTKIFIQWSVVPSVLQKCFCWCHSTVTQALLTWLGSQELLPEFRSTSLLATCRSCEGFQVVCWSQSQGICSSKDEALSQMEKKNPNKHKELFLQAYSPVDCKGCFSWQWDFSTCSFSLSLLQKKSQFQFSDNIASLSRYRDEKALVGYM